MSFRSIEVNDDDDNRPNNNYDNLYGVVTGHTATRAPHKQLNRVSLYQTGKF